MELRVCMLIVKLVYELKGVRVSVSELKVV